MQYPKFSKEKGFMPKQILYIDMDGVVADFDKAIRQICPNFDTIADPGKRADKVDEICGNNTMIFRYLQPIPYAIGCVKILFTYYDIYFLSTPMYHVPASYTDKRVWLEKHFGELAAKRLILTHRKDLCIGDFLVDDRVKHGVDKFQGRHIHFGQGMFKGWYEVAWHLLFMAGFAKEEFEQQFNSFTKQ